VLSNNGGTNIPITYRAIISYFAKYDGNDLDEKQALTAKSPGVIVADMVLKECINRTYPL
jgi:hypothetical protein